MHIQEALPAWGGNHQEKEWKPINPAKRTTRWLADYGYAKVDWTSQSGKLFRIDADVEIPMLAFWDGLLY